MKGLGDLYVKKTKFLKFFRDTWKFSKTTVHKKKLTVGGRLATAIFLFISVRLSPWLGGLVVRKDVVLSLIIGTRFADFSAYNLYPFCRFFKDKSLVKIHNLARGLGRGGDLIFCISFWKLFANEIGRHGRPYLLIKYFSNRKGKETKKTQGKARKPTNVSGKHSKLSGLHMGKAGK